VGEDVCEMKRIIKRSKKRAERGRVEKTNVGFLLPVGLVNEFRKHCIDTGERPGELMAKIIERYLEEQDKEI